MKASPRQASHATPSRGLLRRCAELARSENFRFVGEPFYGRDNSYIRGIMNLLTNKVSDNRHLKVSNQTANANTYLWYAMHKEWKPIDGGFGFDKWRKE